MKRRVEPDGLCRSCGAPVVWAHTSKGNRIPLDPDTKSEGLCEYNNGRVVVHGQTPWTWTGTLHDSHFVTCPDAGAWRK